MRVLLIIVESGEQKLGKTHRFQKTRKTSVSETENPSFSLTSHDYFQLTES